MSSCKVSVLLLSIFTLNRTQSTNFSKPPKYEVSQKIRPVRVALLDADRRSDRHDKANSRFQAAALRTDMLLVLRAQRIVKGDMSPVYACMHTHTHTHTLYIYIYIYILHTNTWFCVSWDCEPHFCVPSRGKRLDTRLFHTQYTDGETRPTRSSWEACCSRGNVMLPGRHFEKEIVLCPFTWQNLDWTLKQFWKT